MKTINADSFIVLPEMKSKSFELVLTDPPYDFTKEQMGSLHSELLRVANTVIVFCPPENPWTGSPDQILFWIKPISTKNTTRRYSRFVEQIYIYQTQSSKWNSNRHWSNYTNVFTDTIVEKVYHPFIKPSSLLERLILNHTDPKDAILDPFAGSGSVHLAATRLDRKCTSIELDKENYKVMQERLDVSTI